MGLLLLGLVVVSLLVQNPTAQANHHLSIFVNQAPWLGTFSSPSGRTVTFRVLTGGLHPTSLRAIWLVYKLLPSQTTCVFGQDMSSVAGTQTGQPSYTLILDDDYGRGDRICALATLTGPGYLVSDRAHSTIYEIPVDLDPIPSNWPEPQLEPQAALPPVPSQGSRSTRDSTSVATKPTQSSPCARLWWQ